MTQAERDRLVALKKVKKKIITQRAAAEELGLSVRQVQRLLKGLEALGDRAVVHRSRGKPSNRRIAANVEESAVEILSAPVYAGFGPRRNRFGELVEWDTSEHAWLEGRGDKLYLIAMIDDATRRLWARFVRHDSTEENMRLLWSYVEKFGRPVAF